MHSAFQQVLNRGENIIQQGSEFISTPNSDGCFRLMFITPTHLILVFLPALTPALPNITSFPHGNKIEISSCKQRKKVVKNCKDVSSYLLHHSKKDKNEPIAHGQLCSPIEEFFSFCLF